MPILSLKQAMTFAHAENIDYNLRMERGE